MGIIITGGEWKTQLPTDIEFYHHLCGCIIGAAKWQYYTGTYGNYTLVKTDIAYVLVDYRHEDTTDYLTYQDQCITACPGCGNDILPETLQKLRTTQEVSSSALTVKDTSDKTCWGEL